jgi:hypothetical protein
VPVAPVHLLSRLSPVQGLLLCAKHLFVAAMVAWVHPGLPGTRRIRRERGRSAFEAAKYVIEPKPTAAGRSIGTLLSAEADVWLAGGDYLIHIK